MSSISFLSGCTVLSMSCYSVGGSLLKKERALDIKTGTPLAVGAAIGGVAGKQIFSALKAMAANPNGVGAVQAACLGVITGATLLYTINRRRIQTYRVRNGAACVLIGLVLGISSSFLGIGGGIVGRAVNQKISSAVIDRLFIGLMAGIICICVYNVWGCLRPA